VGSWRAVSLR